MSIYLITYDLNAEGQNYEEVLKTIEGFDYFKLCDSSYVVKTSFSIDELWARFESSIDDNDYFHILELSPKFNGRTSNKSFKKWFCEPMKVKSFIKLVDELLGK